jgi:hypothetical protein
VTTFGDFDDLDALDHEPADPEQVARKLQTLRRDRDGTVAHWDDLTVAEQTAAVAVAVALLAWLRRQGSLR